MVSAHIENSKAWQACACRGGGRRWLEAGEVVATDVQCCQLPQSCESSWGKGTNSVACPVKSFKLCAHTTVVLALCSTRWIMPAMGTPCRSDCCLAKALLVAHGQIERHTRQVRKTFRQLRNAVVRHVQVLQGQCLTEGGGKLLQVVVCDV